MKKLWRRLVLLSGIKPFTWGAISLWQARKPIEPPTDARSATVQEIREDLDRYRIQRLERTLKIFLGVPAMIFGIALVYFWWRVAL